MNTGFDVRAPTVCPSKCEWSSKVHGLICPQGGCIGVKPMRVLGLDIASAVGWAWSADGKTISHSGTWDCSIQKNESSGMRLLRFRGKLNEVKNTVGVDLIVFETGVHYMQSRGASALVQPEMQGVMKEWCESQNPKVEYKGYAVKSIKSHATGNGAAKKQAMVLAAQKKWKRPFESEDEADAMWILDYALKELGL